jgi:vacuolar-type H+-ATPase subunit H
MQTYFKELTRVFKDFKRAENKLNADFQSAKESGRYNKQYLRELSAENQQKLSSLRKSANARFDAIRADLEKELNATNSINGGFLSDALVKLLTSPIRLTADEYTELAKRHADSATNSRLLRDSAAAHGLTLENYNSTVDILATFDIAVERLQKSMF